MTGRPVVLTRNVMRVFGYHDSIYYRLVILLMSYQLVKGPTIPSREQSSEFGVVL